MIIDLLRHGETKAGACFLGSTDAGLSKVGWQQMTAATKKIKHDLIVSSSMKRCREFSERLAQENNTPVVIKKDLREICFGDWEGKKSEIIWNENKELLTEFWNDPVNNTPPNAEPYNCFDNRIKKVLNSILINNKQDNVLLIVHGGVIRNILSSTLSIPFKSTLKLNIDYAGLTRMEYKDGISSIKFINRTESI